MLSVETYYCSAGYKLYTETKEEVHGLSSYVSTRLWLMVRISLAMYWGLPRQSGLPVGNDSEGGKQALQNTRVGLSPVPLLPVPLALNMKNKVSKQILKGEEDCDVLFILGWQNGQVAQNSDQQKHSLTDQFW